MSKKKLEAKMSDPENQKAQRKAYEHSKAIRGTAEEIQQKLESGNLRSALAHIGFLMKHLGDCTKELNMAMSKADDGGCLPSLPRDACEF